jgi:uncharacterized protein (TIGR02145 family)
MKKLLTLLVLINFNINAQVITIGTQTWSTKNLEVSTYRNGDTIPQVESEADWAKLSTGAWCYSEKDNGTVYGKLYNWYAVKDARGLAPNGFHIPSDAEWTILTDNLGGAEIAGSTMKSILGWHGSIKATMLVAFRRYLVVVAITMVPLATLVIMVTGGVRLRTIPFTLFTDT